MTIKEALTTKAQNLGISESRIDLALLEGNLIGVDQYEPSTMAKDLDLVYVALLLESIGINEVREDDVSIKYTTNLKQIVSSIYLKWGMVDPYAAPIARVTQKLIW